MIAKDQFPCGTRWNMQAWNLYVSARVGCHESYHGSSGYKNKIFPNTILHIFILFTFDAVMHGLQYKSDAQEWSLQGCQNSENTQMFFAHQQIHGIQALLFESCTQNLTVSYVIFCHIFVSPRHLAISHLQLISFLRIDMTNPGLIVGLRPAMWDVTW